MKPLGSTRWAIPEGYIPAWSNGPQPEFTSHETVCILNTGDGDAHVEITIYYADREPVGPYRITVPARRTRHVRFNDLKDLEPIPAATDFASVIESDVPVIVQHTPARFAPGGTRPAQHDRVCGEVRGWSGGVMEHFPYYNTLNFLCPPG